MILFENEFDSPTGFWNKKKKEVDIKFDAEEVIRKTTSISLAKTKRKILNLGFSSPP